MQAAPGAGGLSGGERLCEGPHPIGMEGTADPGGQSLRVEVETVEHLGAETLIEEEIRVSVDGEQTLSHGMSAQDVARTISTALGERRTSNFAVTVLPFSRSHACLGEITGMRHSLRRGDGRGRPGEGGVAGRTRGPSGSN